MSPFGFIYLFLIMLFWPSSETLAKSRWVLLYEQLNLHPTLSVNQVFILSHYASVLIPQGQEPETSTIRDNSYAQSSWKSFKISIYRKPTNLVNNPIPPAIHILPPIAPICCNLVPGSSLHGALHGHILSFGVVNNKKFCPPAVLVPVSLHQKNLQILYKKILLHVDIVYSFLYFIFCMY